jgi:hypothetical protein
MQCLKSCKKSRNYALHHGNYSLLNFHNLTTCVTIFLSKERKHELWFEPYRDELIEENESSNQCDGVASSSIFLHVCMLIRVTD